MEWVYDDGGRAAAEFKGRANDCTTRAIAIATGTPYRDVYNMVNAAARALSFTTGLDHGSAREGCTRDVYGEILAQMGWEWVPTMRIGSGCTTHLRADELPRGNIIARVSKHLVAVIDGVIHDTFDPSRNGTRCVYGVYVRPSYDMSCE